MCIYIQVYDCWWTFNLTVTIQQHKQKKQLHKQLTTTDIESNNNKVVIFIQPTRIHNMTKVSMLIKQSRCTKKKHGHIKQAKCVLYTGNIWRCQSNFQTIVFGCANLQIHWFSPSKANHVHPFCGIWEVHLSHIARWACWKSVAPRFCPYPKKSGPCLQALVRAANFLDIPNGQLTLDILDGAQLSTGTW